MKKIFKNMKKIFSFLFDKAVILILPFLMMINLAFQPGPFLKNEGQSNSVYTASVSSIGDTTQAVLLAEDHMISVDEEGGVQTLGDTVDIPIGGNGSIIISIPPPASNSSQDLIRYVLSLVGSLLVAIILLLLRTRAPAWFGGREKQNVL